MLVKMFTGKQMMTGCKDVLLNMYFFLYIVDGCGDRRLGKVNIDNILIFALVHWYYTCTGKMICIAVLVGFLSNTIVTCRIAWL